MERQFTIFGPKEALSDFAELAESSRMTVEKTEFVPLSAGPTNSIETLCLALKENGTAAVAAVALAQIIVAFLRGRTERRVTITKNAKDGTTSIDVKGYSPEQLKQMLEDCREVVVFAPPQKAKNK